MPINSTAILTRIREVIEGAGSFRAITSGRFSGTLYDGMSDAQAAAASLMASGLAVAEPHLRITGPNAARPYQPASFDLLDIEVRVRVARDLTGEHKVDDALRDDAAGLAANDGELLQGALCAGAGNLSQTAAGTSTGIVSASLMYDGSAEPDLRLTDGSSVVITDHFFHGIVNVSKALS